MEGDYIRRCLRMLDHLTSSYYLKSLLEVSYLSQQEHIQKTRNVQTTEYKKRITYFANLLKSRNKINQDLPPEKIAAPHTPASKLSKIAEEAAIYFQQGQEMLQTSQDMPENTGPLVEYYGFLQCVKGSTVLELDINRDEFFKYHGLRALPTKKSNYINAEIKPFGVFQALLLYRKPKLMTPEEAMDKFLSGSYCPSLKEIVMDRHSHGDPIHAFIGSWMLSTLVRYRPRTWQEIRLGRKDDIIRWIRVYRRIEISYAIQNLLSEYDPDFAPAWK